MYRWAALLYALIILYGSLVPFEVQPLALDDLLDRFLMVCATPEPVVSRSDLAANILLFVPMGFLAMEAVIANRERRGWVAVLPVACLCTVLGACAEALQLLVPARICSRNDIMAQAAGSLLGAASWVIVSRYLEIWSQRLLARWGATPRQAGLVVTYFAFIVLVETAPFDFTLSPVEIVHKWREGRIHVVPFAAFFDPERHMVKKTLTQLVLFLPLGLLLASRVRYTRYAILFAVVAAGAVECFQAFVLTRNFEATDIITGTAAVWLGWRVATSLRATTGWRAFAFFATWVAVAVVLHWYPFQFSMRGASERWRALAWVPLADYAEKQYLVAFDEIAHTALLYALLGLLIAWVITLPRPGWICFAVGAVAAAILEAGQLFLPERYPSVSEVGIGAVGCALGGVLAHVLKRSGDTLDDAGNHIMNRHGTTETSRA
jgi:VanZ family protein